MIVTVLPQPELAALGAAFARAHRDEADGALLIAEAARRVVAAVSPESVREIDE